MANASQLPGHLLQQRDVLLQRDKDQTTLRANRIILSILSVEWVICIVTAFLTSPKTWSGPDPSTHLHVYLAILGGGLLTLFPAYLAWRHGNHPATRIVIAIAAVMFTTIYTTILGGRQDAHFIFFVNAAFLAMYEDFFVMLATTLTIALDHLIRNIIAPYSIFGSSGPDWPIFFLHVMWAVLIVVGIVIYNFASLKIKKENAEKQVYAMDEVQKKSRTMEEQTQELASSASILLNAMNEFSRGNLSVNIADHRDDDMGLLMKGFNTTVQTVGQLIYSVKENVEMTLSISAQLSEQTNHIEQAIQSQVMQTHDVSAAIEEMSSTITDNARTATGAANEAESGERLAHNGGNVTRQTIEKMNQIARIVAESTETIERLGVSSQQIGEIVSVINDIADQTNLLALNAAIEAARAGEQGRGFAVVADEVRKLAERTAVSTKQISQMIRTIQQETNQAVHQMRQGNIAVTEGTTLATEAGAALQSIVESASAIQVSVNQIAAATEQQSSTSSQIARSMESIMAISNDTGQSVQYIAGTTQELLQAAERLQSTIRLFSVASSSASLSSSSYQTKQLRS